MRCRRLVAFGAAATLLVTPGAWAGSKPVITPSAVTASPGERVVLVTAEWPPNAIVTGVVCGNAGVRGSIDCTPSKGASVIVRPGSEARLGMVLAVPPMPCPCLIRLTDRSGTKVDVPLRLLGVAEAAPVGSGTLPSLVDVDAELVPRRRGLIERIRGVLGGPRHWSLVVTVQSKVESPIEDVAVTAALGRRTGAGRTLENPDPITLPPGGERRFVVPVETEAPLFGRYVVSGTVYAGRDSMPFSARTTVIPWGVMVVLALVLVVVGVLIASRRLGAGTVAGEH